MKRKKLLFLLPLAFVVFLTRAQTTAKESVRDFVTKVYIHGLPYEQAKAYGKSAVPELVKMLNEPGLEKYWTNIIVSLGYIGDPAAVKPLVSFMQNSKGEISLARFNAILYVFQALGHISQSGDALSLNTLIDYTNLDSWKTRKLQFGYSRYNAAALSEVLARQAIVGLGISGQPAAMKKLNELRQSKQTRSDWQDNLDEATIVNKRVRTEGAKKVFGQKQ